LKLKFPYGKWTGQIYFDRQKQIQLSVAWPALMLFGYFFDRSLMQAFSLMWPLVLLSVIVLEALFQKINRMRSQRNMIYLIYIIICLLDSHIEGRMKICAKFFDL
jgi:cellulose synthase/poly-beta-1,6-N-acetylglucosamine synthase-like glycosyltransferase